MSYHKQLRRDLPALVDPVVHAAVTDDGLVHRQHNQGVVLQDHAHLTVFLFTLHRLHGDRSEEHRKGRRRLVWTQFGHGRCETAVAARRQLSAQARVGSATPASVHAAGAATAAAGLTPPLLGACLRLSR